jgi:hypothetical protein
MSTQPPDRLRTLKLVHEDIVGERDRLRSARAAITSQLGPLPASAGIVIGLVGSLDHRVERGFLIAAGALFGLVMLVSIRYSRLAPYRVLRARRVLRDRQSGAECPGDSMPMESGDKGEPEPWYIGSTVDRSLKPADWLTRKIALEEQIYGSLRKDQRVGLRRCIKRLACPSRNVTDLQGSFDVELTALNIVQGLFACIVIVLLIGIVAN